MIWMNEVFLNLWKKKFFKPEIDYPLHGGYVLPQRFALCYKSYL